MAAVGKSLQVLTYGAAPKLTPVIPEGPHLPEDPWNRTARYADEALVLAKEARPYAAWRLLALAWGQVAEQAARRIAHITGTEVKYYGAYSKNPTAKMGGHPL
eukprot:5808137-Pyramimonas_sp.AAC.1